MTAKHGAEERRFRKERKGMGNRFGMLLPLTPEDIGCLTDVEVMQQMVHSAHRLNRLEQASGNMGQEVRRGNIRKALSQGLKI